MSTTIGVQLFDATGASYWDSRTAIGGIVGDWRTYASGDAGETINYTQWAGLSAYLLDCGGSDGFVALSTSSGYPSVTVTSPSGPMSFALIVF